VRRATVEFNFPRASDNGDKVHEEWVHEHQCTIGDACSGVWFDWGDGTEAFFPWASVRRLDFDECLCFECSRKNEKNPA